MGMRRYHQRPPTPRAGLVLLAWLALPLAGGCGPRPGSPSSRRPNLILVTLDTTRADHLGAYGQRGASTPTLDRLARRGVQFEEALATAPVTLPAHASLLTGQLPVRHGARDNAIYVLGDEGNETLAEILGSHGYATGAVVSAFVLDRRFGLAQGFERFDDDPNSMRSTAPRLDPERRAGAATDAALALARELAVGGGAGGGRGERPLFLWVHYFDPHTPFDAPEPYASWYPTTPADPYGDYDGEIAYVDREIGRLLVGLRRRGLLDRALVAVVGDHGEGLESPHEETSHGILLFEETLRVPFLLWDSTGTLRAAPVRGAVAGVDLLPTLLSLLDVEVPGPVAGVSLAGAIRRGVAPPDRPLVSETLHPFDLYGWSPLASVRRNRWKYVRGPRPELYDLEADPGESRDLAREAPQEAARMARFLKETVGRWERPARAGGFSLSRADRQKLRSLGYLSQVSAGRTPPPPEEYPDANPRDLIGLHHDLQLVAAALGSGDDTRADELLRGVLARDPENILALRYLGDLQGRRGLLEEAVATYRRAVALHPDLHEIQDNLGVLLMNLGNRLRAQGRAPEAMREFREAEAAFRQAIEDFPLHHFAMSNLANLYMNWWPEPRNAEAEEWFRRAIEVNPREPISHLGYGWLLFRLERGEEARREIEAAEGLRESGFGQYLLGECLLLAGDRAGARERYVRAVELEPGLAEARARLRELGGGG